MDNENQNERMLLFLKGYMQGITDAKRIIESCNTSFDTIVTQVEQKTGVNLKELNDKPWEDLFN